MISYGMDRLTALDVIEAVDRSGGEACLRPPYPNGTYGVGILSLPDVRRFLRALASLGVTATPVYSVGSGWRFETRKLREVGGAK